MATTWSSHFKSELTITPRILYTDIRSTIVDETVSGTTDSLLSDTIDLLEWETPAFISTNKLCRIFRSDPDLQCVSTIWKMSGPSPKMWGPNVRVVLRQHRDWNEIEYYQPENRQVHDESRLHFLKIWWTLVHKPLILKYQFWSSSERHFLHSHWGHWTQPSYSTCSAMNHI